MGGVSDVHLISVFSARSLILHPDSPQPLPSMMLLTTTSPQILPQSTTQPTLYFRNQQITSDKTIVSNNERFRSTRITDGINITYKVIIISV